MWKIKHEWRSLKITKFVENNFSKNKQKLLILKAKEDKNENEHIIKYDKS